VLKPDLRETPRDTERLEMGCFPIDTSDLGEADADCSDCGCHGFAVRTSCHIAGMWLQSKGSAECQLVVMWFWLFVVVPLATPR
jgi:hypothetical protein